MSYGEAQVDWEPNVFRRWSISNTFSDPSQRPILARRTYSDNRAEEYFFLKAFDDQELKKIVEDSDNLERLKLYMTVSKKIKRVALHLAPLEWGVFFLTKNREEDQIDQVMLGAVGPIYSSFKEFSATDKNVPNMEEQLAAWVCAPTYMQKQVGCPVLGMIRMAAPIYVQNYMHTKGLSQVRAQARTKKKNTKSNKAMQSVAKEKIGEDVTSGMPRNYYEHTFQKLEKDNTLGEISTADLIKLLPTVPLNQSKSHKKESPVGIYLILMIGVTLTCGAIYKSKQKTKKSTKKKSLQEVSG